MSARTVRVGCCGWAAAHARYFEQFRVIELQSTFYQLPSADLARKWQREAPEDFRFCLKAWQLITHPASSPTYRKLKTPLEEESKAAVGGFQMTPEVWSAWDKTLEIARILLADVILFQCPASFRPTEQNVRGLQEFFGKLRACGHRLAWEPRGDWPEELVRELCDELHLVHCVDPFVGKPASQGIRYYRLHGRGGYRYRYSDAELQELHAKLYADSSPERYVLFNNTWMWEDAARFLALAR